MHYRLNSIKGGLPRGPITNVTWNEFKAWMSPHAKK
jgi:hypothetical protein